MFSFFSKKSYLIDLFKHGYTDIHCHVLPCIDDGAKNVHESEALLNEMQNIGFKHITATPHIMDGVWENTPETITTALANLKMHLSKTGLSEFSIATAAEYMLDNNFEKLLHNHEELLPLKDNKILVELSYFNPPLNLKEILFQLQVKGYSPILAHPERYNFYHNNYSQYKKLKEAGCQLQLNLLSLTPHYGKGVQKIAYQLLDDDLIDFVGSDTHHLQHIALLKTIQVKAKYITKIQKLVEANELLLP